MVRVRSTTGSSEIVKTYTRFNYQSGNTPLMSTSNTDIFGPTFAVSANIYDSTYKAFRLFDGRTPTNAGQEVGHNMIYQSSAGGYCYIVISFPQPTKLMTLSFVEKTEYTERIPTWMEVYGVNKIQVATPYSYSNVNNLRKNNQLPMIGSRLTFGTKTWGKTYSFTLNTSYTDNNDYYDGFLLYGDSGQRGGYGVLEIGELYFTSYYKIETPIINNPKLYAESSGYLRGIN